MTNFLKGLSVRNKIIGIAVLVFLVLLIVSIPGDRKELLDRQERVEASQVAYNMAFPAVGPVMESVVAFLDNSGIDLSDNRSYTSLPNSLTTFNRANSSIANKFQAVITFHKNVHLLVDGAIAVPELDTAEFQGLVNEMDITLSVAWLALMEMNTAIDEYNSYHNWISAKVTGALFGLPEGYTDPVLPRSRLNSDISLELPAQ